MSDNKFPEEINEEKRQRADAEADHRLAGIEHVRQERAAEYHEERIAELESLIEEKEDVMPEEIEALTPVEISLRTVNPEKFRQLIADRTKALLEPGREEELRRWLDGRAAADQAWEARQAKFQAETFAEFVKETEGSLSPSIMDKEISQSPTTEPYKEELSSEAQRIVAAWKDPVVFEEVLDENRRLNAAEAERQRGDLLPVRELKVPASLEHLVEEIRSIVQTERITRKEMAEYLGVLVRESLHAPNEPIETPESHYPPDATPEQIAIWQKQEQDERMEAASKVARENREHVEMMQLHTLPPMSAAEKRELLDEITRASASLAPHLAPTHDSPKIKL